MTPTLAIATESKQYHGPRIKKEQFPNLFSEHADLINFGSRRRATCVSTRQTKLDFAGTLSRERAGKIRSRFLRLTAQILKRHHEVEDHQTTNYGGQRNFIQMYTHVTYFDKINPLSFVFEGAASILFFARLPVRSCEARCQDEQAKGGPRQKERNGACV